MVIQAPVANGVVTYSDASATGCASVFTPQPNRQKLVIHRPFSEEEMKTSSTYRELFCVYHGLDQTKDVLKGQSIRWFTDSANIVSIIRKGSMVPDLLQLAILIFDITRKYHIQLAMTWVSRQQNTEADAMSRVIDYDDWGVHPNWFKHICSKLGQADFDRFADQNNAKTKLHNSRFFTSDTAGIDAFTQDWTGHLNWLVPPIRSTLRCRGILVVPMWESAYYWPLLQDIIVHKAHVVEDHIILGDIFQHYRNKSSIFGSSQWKGQTLDATPMTYALCYLHACRLYQLPPEVTMIYCNATIVNMPSSFFPQEYCLLDIGRDWVNSHTLISYVHWSCCPRWSSLLVKRIPYDAT